MNVNLLSCAILALLVTILPKATALMRDLQNESPSLQEALAQIDACPVCRSVEEIQETGWLRALLAHSMLGWFHRHPAETWFIDALQKKELPIGDVDLSQWTSMSEDLRTRAQTLRQDGTRRDPSFLSPVEQYEYFLIDFLASALEALSTMTDQFRNDWIDRTTVPLLDISGRIVSLVGFQTDVLQMIASLSHALLCTIALWQPSGTAPEILETASGTLDRYADALQSHCAEEDSSFVDWQDTAEALTLDLAAKRDALLLLGEQVLPTSSSETTGALIQRIRDVLYVIVVFPGGSLVLLSRLVIELCAFFVYYLFPPILLVPIMATIILSLLLASPLLYLMAIVETAMRGLEEGCFGQGGMSNEVADTLSLMKKKPFLLSMEDVECQMQAISCQTDAWAQMLPT